VDNSNYSGNIVVLDTVKFTQTIYIDASAASKLCGIGSITNINAVLNKGNAKIRVGRYYVRKLEMYNSKYMLKLIELGMYKL